MDSESIRAAARQVFDWVVEPGVIKTPTFLAGGWITWSNVRGALEVIVFLLTALIVIVHAWNTIAGQYCPRRRTGICGDCPFQKTILCPKGTKEESEI